MQRAVLSSGLIILIALVIFTLAGFSATPSYAYPPIITASPTPAQTVSTPALLPAHVVVTHESGARLRSGPGTEYDIVRTVAAGATFDVVGSALDGKSEIWYLVTVEDSDSSWIAGSVVVSLSADPGDSPTASSTMSGETPSRESSANAWINSKERVRLRSGPGLHYPDIDRVLPGDPLRLITAYTRIKYHPAEPDNTWYLVQIENGEYGWVFSELVGTLLSNPHRPPPVPTPTVSPAAAEVDIPAEIILPDETLANARSIFELGQELKNRPDRFIIIGDSTSAGNEYTLPAFCAFHWGSYRLGPYESLQSTINEYRTSFCANNITLRSGLSSSAVLDPLWANPAFCRTGENPLECEVRRTRPSIALIYIGLVDITYSTTEIYAANLDTILVYLIEHGVIPVLHTVPSSDRMTAARGYVERMAELNRIIREAAAGYRLPLIDLRTATARLPNQGCIEEGFHLSYRVDGVLDFTGDEAVYGKDLRELLTLQLLRDLRLNVMAEG